MRKFTTEMVIQNALASELLQAILEKVTKN